MKLKRVELEATGEKSIAIWEEGEWVPLISALRALGIFRKKPYALLEEAADDVIMFLSGGDTLRTLARDLVSSHISRKKRIPVSLRNIPLLPFQPRSYRDFMLFERHVIDAGRGYAKRFLPKSSGVLSLYEKTTGRTFPKLKPKSIWYKKPIYYMGNHLNFYPDESLIPWPSYTKALDYECELGIIIAKPIKNASEEEAEAAIGGFTILNDFSARDVQREEMESGFGPVKAKNFANAIAEVIVTPDEILPDLDNLTARVFINGELKNEGTTAGPQHSLQKAIAYASLEEQIVPGEFMASGTIPGCSGMESGNWLQPGDILRLEIDKIGSLTSTIGAP